MDRLNMSNFWNFLSTIEGASERLPLLENYVQRLENDMSSMQPRDGELVHILLLKDAVKACRMEEMKKKKNDIISESKQSEVTQLFLLKGNRGSSRDDQLRATMQTNEGTCADKTQWISSSPPMRNISSNNTHNSSVQLSQRATSNTDQPCIKWGNGQQKLFNMPSAANLRFPVASILTQGEGRDNNKGCIRLAMAPVSRAAFLTPTTMAPVITPSNPQHLDLRQANVGRDESKVINIIPATNSVGHGRSRMGSIGRRRKPLKEASWKSHRRCWTPELHARFVHALKIHGGPEAATPKQIREVMQVEGLTNDQVKSHLQKYRIHYRRLSAANRAKRMLVFEQLWAPICQPTATDPSSLVHVLQQPRVQSECNHNQLAGSFHTAGTCFSQYEQCKEQLRRLP
ncbi:uncharacterized protein LOC131160627 [Malania oleifera]|uniref:uncharacterized protein LOC131160627 n=1 Tax=Malania oleifera TaxID=397392 RepID=UPI0025ADB050|nr:uncharacterized protein LOC131160627 [Malania oleifera]